jgi:hypothetical protein
MEMSGLLQGLGLMVCVGAILLIALVAFAARALAGRRGQNQSQTMWNTRGQEQPRYDEPDIQTRGGFGGVPTTGSEFGRDESFGRGQSGFGEAQRGLGSAQSFDPDRDRPADPPADRDRSRHDDDNVRSSGGFGGG